MKLTSALLVLAACAGVSQAQLAGSAVLTGTDLGGGMTHYTGTVHNSGTTTVGTFWYAWVPGYDFMPHAPQNIVAPAGWIGFEQGGFINDGYSIMFYALSSSDYIPVGGDLSGFEFDSADSVAVMNANSTAVPRPYITSTSYLYIGSPEADIGYQFIATVNAGVTACYANCDNSSVAPVLNVADFTCFLQKYAAGDPYANCDNSSVAPVLNVADFTCFLQKYAAGCP